jgi:glycosyltransferase involved in cell wall biosynthesis
MPELSIVIPMFNEAAGLEALFSRLQPILEELTPDYEIVCVDDGSRDDTYLHLKAWNVRDARVKAIRFSRNFGKETALSAGIDAASGRAVIPIDADLQDPPELIREMWAKWKEGYQVVLATRRSRPHDSWLKRKSAEWFYALMNKVSTVKVPPNTGDFRLMDRQVVEAVKRFTERTRFMKGLFAWVGFKTTALYFDREPRAMGQTTFDYWRLWKFALDGIFSFTTVPLRIWIYVGATISLLSFAAAAALILRTLIYGRDFPGYASLMVVMLFMGGIQLLSLGVIGEYVGRIYRETKQRPLYLVQERVGL